MERALAAIHQSHRVVESIVLLYTAISGRVGLFLHCADAVDEVVTGPVAANYPNCTLAAVENLDQPPPGWRTWSTMLKLTPNFSDFASRAIRGRFERHVR